MRSFCVSGGFWLSGIAVYSPNSGYPSAEAPYFDLARALVFGSCCHVNRDTVPKVVYTESYGASMDKGD